MLTQLFTYSIKITKAIQTRQKTLNVRLKKNCEPSSKAFLPIATNFNELPL